MLKAAISEEKNYFAEKLSFLSRGGSNSRFHLPISSLGDVPPGITPLTLGSGTGQTLLLSFVRLAELLHRLREI
jgi:hypothetical protein